MVKAHLEMACSEIILYFLGHLPSDQIWISFVVVLLLVDCCEIVPWMPSTHLSQIEMVLLQLL